MNLSPIKSSYNRLHAMLVHWFSPPSLLAAGMPSEIIPTGLVSLDLNVRGWGWVRLDGPDAPGSRTWFPGDRRLTLFLPVGTQPLLRLTNLWGSRQYQVDARPQRTEVWAPYSSRFRLKPPSDVEIKPPNACIIGHTQLWNIAGNNSLATKNWKVQTPEFTAQLPVLNTVALPSWHTQLPLDALEQRIQLTRNPDRAT